MVGIDDAFDDMRVAFSDPPKREERAFGPGIRKKLENAVNIALDSAFAVTPFGSWDVVKERLDLKIIFNIDGHCVETGIVA